MSRSLSTLIGIVGGAVGLALGVAAMTGLIPSTDQVTLLAVGQFAMGVGLVSLVSAQGRASK